jgi:trehalose 6-phosphate synthase/phosphatase
LRDLAARPNIQVHIVSGRTRGSIEKWFGDLPVGLHAEHGLWSRAPGDDWRMIKHEPADWKTVVRPILDRVTGETPGTFIEDKTAGLAWHYRQADDDDSPGGLSDAQASELALLLAELLTNVPVEVMSGNKVIEIRPQDVDKGSIVPDALATSDGLIVAIGDDRTDEDLFGALPKESVTVRVGGGETSARYRLRNFSDVRELLSALRSSPSSQSLS